MKELEQAANAVLEHVHKGPRVKVDNVTLRFIENVREVARWGGDAAVVHDAMGKIIEEIKRLDQRMDQRMTGIENAQKAASQATSSDASATHWRAFAARQWRQGTQEADPPATQSFGSRPSAPGVPHREPAADSEVVVKVRDEAVRDRLRQCRPVQILQEAEKARQAAARKELSAALAGAVFIAARQLPSGDLTLRARDAANAEVFRQMSDSWVKVFRQGAFVRIPTWGVVVHGVSIGSIDLATESLEKEANRMIQAIAYTWGAGAKILYMGWLIKPRKAKPNGSVIVEFSDPRVANRAIENGTIWEAFTHPTTIYVRDARSQISQQTTG